MSKLKKKNATDSSTSNTRFCTICQLHVNLGNGGEANWTTHLGSAAHCLRERAGSKTKPLTAWFGKAVKGLDPPRASSSKRLTPPPLFNKLPSYDRVPVFSSTDKNPPTALFLRFRQAIDTLPDSVPLGTPSDVLAQFSGDPSAGIEKAEEAWEGVDSALNRVIGFGVSVDDIALLVRRGDFGMDGIYSWLEGCISKLRIDEVLLEGKIDRLIDAMVKLYRFETYRSLAGYACFNAQKDNGAGDFGDEIDLNTCRACRNRKIALSKLSGPSLVAHMGGHILHDVKLKDATTPCGFCLSEGNVCTVNLICNAKGIRIDMKNSRCPHLQKLTLKTAAKFTKNSPCTNHPVICPLCPPKTTLAVWKYNLRSHIVTVHPTANVNLYSSYFEVTDMERTLMKAVFETVPRQKKTSKSIPLPISDGHSTRTALREFDGTRSTENDADSETESEGEEVEEIVSEGHESEFEIDVPEAQSAQIGSFGALENTAMGDDDGVSRSRLRKRRRLFDEEAVDVCADDGCEGVISSNDLLRCDAPGCGLTYHLSCRGLLERPEGGWFCDAECKKNAGFRVRGPAKRRKKA